MDHRKKWKIRWHGKKAMALYAVIGLVIAMLSLVMVWQWRNGNEKPNESMQGSAGQLAPEVSDPESAHMTFPFGEPVLVAETVTDLRSLNNVRALRYEEQTMAVTRLSGVWGVGLARVLEGNSRSGDSLMDGVTLQNDPEGWRGVVEIHKTVEGIVSIVGFVEQGSAAKLLDESRPVGNIYFYHEAVRQGLVPVAIPVSRVVTWDYREPHEFSEIVIDGDGG
ncbi:MAG: hypothetical protein F4222_07855 [Gammaproteobacteria bacterium]|nr:hypothetical protein [Gammaproteobacteria bacterium]